MLIDREKLKDIISAIAGKMKFRPAIVEKDYYLTVLMVKDDMIKIEISLRQPPIDKPVYTKIKHFYQNL